MTCRLSKTSLTSFCGDVLPLFLVSDEDITHAEIGWSVAGDAVTLRSFAGDGSTDISHGVLLTFQKCGNAVVTAVLAGRQYCCNVTVRERKQAGPSDPLRFYVGDMHAHTSNIHKADLFADKGCEYPIDMIRQIRDENLIDFSVVTDHAGVTNKRDFFRGFTDTEDAQPMELVMFPGSESEVTVIETDRFGLTHKNSGEIVCLNVDNFVDTDNWQRFYSEMENGDFAVCILAHPQVMGWDRNGIWNFSLHKNNTPQLKHLIKGVEMGNGGDRGSNPINEYVYSVALDNGFRVSCTCASDSHGPVWGADAMPGRTVLLATDKSREAFLDALLARRFYACESGNLKLRYWVNGAAAPAELADTERYCFRVELSCFRDDPSTVPVKCQVISDYGRTVKVIENVDFGSFDFTVESNSARYFYLRFVDAMGRRTWSMPVWTGRACTGTAVSELTALDKSGFTVTEAGVDAAILINNDPYDAWSSKGPTAEIVIDLGREQEISGLGYYPPRFVMRQILDSGMSVSDIVTRFASGYAVYTSSDGIEYRKCADGILRVFGGEEVIIFPAHRTRFVKFEVLSTTGKACELPQYAENNVMIGELTVYGP